MLALARIPNAAAQASSRPGSFAYTPSELDCARFAERSHGTLDTQLGGTRRRERLRRAGSWIVRARPAAEGSPPGSLAVELWLDTLALVREGPAGSLTPDTDGLIGGRYRGTLTPAGGYTAEARPFVPDEVSEVADLSSAAEDLLPPLPPIALAAGQRWADSSGLELRRLPDSTVGGRVVHRLALQSRREADRADVRGDTVAVPAHEVAVEDGEIDWEPGVGLVRRVRYIVVETYVPAGGVARTPLRSRLEQEVVLERAGPGRATGCSERP